MEIRKGRLKCLIDRGEKIVDRLEWLIPPEPKWVHIFDKIWLLIVIGMILFSLLFGVWMVNHPERVLEQPRMERRVV